MTTHQPSGWRDKLLGALLRASLQMLLKPVFSPSWSIAFQRRWLGLISRTTLIPRNVAIAQDTVSGVNGEWHRGPAPAIRLGTLLYLHGGAFCVGSPRSHRALTARLARATGLPVFSIDYRLAPEHPYPAALDDVLAAYRALCAQGPVVIAGDSAGGNLALAAALALREAGDPAPAALMLLSTLADMVLPEPDPPPVPGEAMLTTAWAKACGALYLGGQPADSPTTSPLRADLRGLPPTLIQCGTDDMLYSQSLALHEALRAAGVDSTLDVTQGRWHVFQLHGGVLPSADAAIARLAQFAVASLPATTMTAHSEHEVVIMGAGMSGICMAIQLQRAGQHNFVILEKQPGLGGTWWDNTYPGAHVDVPAPVYSFSFAPNPDWSRRFAGAPEIQAYMQRLAERHGLLAHMRFGTRLTVAAFDEATGQWNFKTERGDTLRSRFFVCSTGPLNQPRWPEIAGLDTFQGQRLHSARWDATVPLNGKRIAVIGTGSTASQLVPPLAAQAGHLHVFQRTANWVLPRLDRPYHALDRALSHFPPYAKTVRWCWTQVLEWGRRGFDEGTLARKGMLKTAAAHLRRQVRNETLRAQLTPPYPLGCKRIIYSNDFYPALGQPNVELVTSTIERITPTGIVTTDGKQRDIDVLVCATGFDAVHLLSGVQVTGQHGQTLAQAWANGPEAYHGISVAGFPNLFLTLGPNTATGHTSTLLYIEPEVQHAIHCMHAVRDSGHQWIAVKPEVQAAHNDDLQLRLNHSVWSRCNSWYRMDGGRIVAIFPGFTSEYVKAVRVPRMVDYRMG